VLDDFDLLAVLAFDRRLAELLDGALVERRMS
jgi:hypothetical protein